MTKPILIPFKPEHLPAGHALRRFGVFGPAWSVQLSDEIIASAGVVILWPGVGEVWARLGDAALARPLWLLRTFRDYLDDVTTMCNLRRIQADVDGRISPCKRLVERLGFTYEGRKRLYGIEGNDVDMYARLRLT